MKFPVELTIYREFCYNLGMTKTGITRKSIVGYAEFNSKNWTYRQASQFKQYLIILDETGRIGAIGDLEYYRIKFMEDNKI